jgi:hypothetical protein
MGLDSYFKIKKYETPDWKELDIHLCGGMMSGHGSDGSFRGKVYSNMIEELTGHSLYQEEINRETIQEIAKRLNKISYESAKDFLAWNFSVQEWEDLKKLFNKAADTENCVLLGWW